MSGAQQNGSALSYGRRQSLVAVLGLTTADEDADGTAHNEAPEPVTESELADLDVLIDEVGADRPAFLKWLRVEALADLPRADLPRAIKALERKRRAP